MIQKKVSLLLMSVTLFLGSYRGYLAIFEKDETEPIQIYACRTDTLPQTDQELLEKRIRVRNRQQLDQILEDYLS